VANQRWITECHHIWCQSGLTGDWKATDCIRRTPTLTSEDEKDEFVLSRWHPEKSAKYQPYGGEKGRKPDRLTKFLLKSFV
jgi:hypothetical protein